MVGDHWTSIVGDVNEAIALEDYEHKVEVELWKLDVQGTAARELTARYPKTIEHGFDLASFPYYVANQIMARENDRRGDDPHLDQFPQE